MIIRRYGDSADCFTGVQPEKIDSDVNILPLYNCKHIRHSLTSSTLNVAARSKQALFWNIIILEFIILKLFASLKYGRKGR